MPRKKSVSLPVPGSKVGQAVLPSTPKKSVSSITSADPSFGLALRAANERLARAIEARAECHARLALLEAEIPSLQSIILALSPQTPSAVTVAHPRASYPLADNVTISRPSKPVASIAKTGATPTYAAVNLKGMGSIPASQIRAVSPVPDFTDENAALEDADGEEVIGDLEVLDAG